MRALDRSKNSISNSGKAMKAIVERAALLKALSHVSSVVERRTTIPILSYVKIVAEGGALALTATDLDIEIIERVAAKICVSGAVTVSAHMLHSVVKRLPDGSEISIASGEDEDRVSLCAGRSRFQLNRLPAGDFPDMSASPMTHSFNMPARDLIKLIQKTRFASSTDEARYYLNGVYLHAARSGAGAVLRAVATDGHRLAQADVPLPPGAEGTPGIIASRKTAAELLKLAGDAGGDLGVELSSTKIRVTIGAPDAPLIVFTSKLIDGAFPDYGRVFPQDCDKTLSVAAGEFARAVDRVSTLASDNGRPVKFSISSGQLTLSTNNLDSGSAVEELPAGYDGPPLEIGFNSRYALDIASEIEGENIVLALANSSTPAVIKDDGDGSVLYVLMPMRI